MDRIEMQGTNGILSRLSAKRVAPLTPSERTKSAADDPAQAQRVERTAMGQAGSHAPIDHDRVAQIRKALDQGTYPLVPHKVADALIAAGIILRSGK